MDPNVTLQRIRKILADYARESEEHELANELVDRIDALDNWLTCGGYLPSDWNTFKR